MATLTAANSTGEGRIIELSEPLDRLSRDDLVQIVCTQEEHIACLKTALRAIQSVLSTAVQWADCEIVNRN